MFSAKTQKKALITGITGQDGSYLAELLLAKGYEVHGVRRRSSSFNTGRIDHLINDINVGNSNLILHHADLIDTPSIIRVLEKSRPHEVYNLAAQSHVAVSFEQPVYTSNCDGLGTLRLLEAIRILGMHNDIRFYQASTSELYGNSSESIQSEKTQFRPCSPYAASKLFSYWITINYREGYGMHASNGILFNHESPRRGELFVTRKITRGLVNIFLGKQNCLYLGNLDAKRDWGHAKDYVEAMWMMLQQAQPNDLVIATGIQHTVREFVEECCKYLNLNIEWIGEGYSESGYCREYKRDIVKVDKRYFRPNEVNSLLGDSNLARTLLNWKPKINFNQMVEEMMQSDFNNYSLK